AQDADALVERRDVASEPGGRPEEEDLDGAAPVDAVEPPDPLLDEPRVPRQVEEDEAAAELEVAALAAALGRDQDGGTGGEADLDGPRAGGGRWGDAPAPLARRALDRRLEPLERLEVRDEAERLLPRLAPAWRLAHEPLRARVGGERLRGLGLRDRLVGDDQRRVRRRRGEGAPVAVETAAPLGRRPRGKPLHPLLEREHGRPPRLRPRVDV